MQLIGWGERGDRPRAEGMISLRTAGEGLTFLSGDRNVTHCQVSPVLYGMVLVFNFLSLSLYIYILETRCALSNQLHKHEVCPIFNNVDICSRVVYTHIFRHYS